MSTWLDLVRMTTPTTGTGTITLSNAVDGFLSVDDAADQAGVTIDGQTVSYAIVDGTSKRATGRGVYTAATKALTRDENEVSSNNGVVGGALDLSGTAQVAITVLAADLAELAGAGNGNFQSTFLVSGGQVIWQSGLTFLVSAATYFIQGTQYNSAQQSITLSAADGSNPRIDVIAVDNTATVVKITGTAAASPSEPDTDPGTQVKLAIVTVAAGATEPTVSNTTIYAENAGDPGEWTGSTSGVGFALAATTNPRTGSNHVAGTAVAANAYAQWQKGSGTFDPNSVDFLIFYMKGVSTIWGTSSGLNITLRSSGVIRGVTIPINRTGSYGFNSGNLTDYQQIAIPTSHFAVPVGQTINQVRFTKFGSGTSLNCRIDDIGFQDGGASGGSGFLTQEQADALYQPLDADLTALAGLSGVQGDVIYHNGTQWQRLGAGTSGHFLKTNGAAANPAWAAASGSSVFEPQGRLTPSSGTPLVTTSVTGAGTVYYAPYKGNMGIFPGASALEMATFTELSQALSDNTKSPAAAAAWRCYDMWTWDDGGTKRCTRGPGWTDGGRTFTVTIASPAVFTLSSHGFVENQPVVFTTTGALPTGLTAGTVYFVSASGLGAQFQVSATRGGAVVNTTGSQSGTHTCTTYVQTRGTGAGTEEHDTTTYPGWIVNARAITNGPGAGRGFYVGTILTDGSSTTNLMLGLVSGSGGGGNIIGVWNAYRQERLVSKCYDNSASWSYTSTTWRARNGNINNCPIFVQGLNRHPVTCHTWVRSQNTNNQSRRIALMLNSTIQTAAPTGISTVESGGNIMTNAAQVMNETFWGLGMNFIGVCEASDAIGTTSWGGSATNVLNLTTLEMLG